jgi:hypothetical protein
MSRYASGAVVAVIAGALALHLSMPASAAISHQDFPPRPGATPIVIGIGTPAPSSAVDNSLTAPQQQHIIAVALKSKYVRRLVRGKSYRVSGATPWLDHAGKLVGGIVHLDFARPVTVNGTWLASGRKPYKATYRNVNGLMVYVGLKRGKVMVISPR